MNFKKSMGVLSLALALIIGMGFIIPSVAGSAEAAEPSIHQPALSRASQEVTSADKNFKGLWVATVYNLDYPSVQTSSAEKLKSDAVEILDFAQKNGYNAIVFQARPAADSFFKSDYFPWSRFLSGEQGKAPSDNFDPLDFWVSEAHKRGLELHAWLNPYRVTKKDSSDENFDFSKLSQNHPARLHPEWTVKYSDGNLYFDPGIPEVRQLIIDSVCEIVKNYDVDGIHFDDYFYPGSDFNDQQTYKTYGASYSSIGDFRRASVDLLISGVGTAIKSLDSDCRFGISPFGIWANKSENPLGSDTRGTQSYYDHFADTRKWVKNNMVDYIAPQLYWDIGNKISCYQKLLNWWCDTVSGTNVDLYIGQAAYRAQNSDKQSVWYGTAEIDRQLALNKQSNIVHGSIFFRYKYLKNNPTLTKSISAFFEKNSYDNSAASDNQNPSANSGQTNSSPSSSGGNQSGTPGFTPPQQNNSSSGANNAKHKSLILSIFEKSLKSAAQAFKHFIATENINLNSTSQSGTPNNGASDWAVLTVARPSSDLSTTYKNFYFTGQSDPSLPLYINGEQITNRSESGFYGKLVALNPGNNTITVSQGDRSVKRSIYCGSTPAKPLTMDSPAIIQNSTFPQSPEFRQAGEKVTLKCTAPAGSSVTAEIYGKTFSLKPASSASSGSSIIQCVYSASYTIPSVSGKAQNIDLGSVKYTAQYNGKTYSAVSPSKIGVILKNSPFYATVTKDLIDTYKTQSTSGGRHTYLTLGMRSYITGMSGQMVRLGQNCWIKKDDAKIEILPSTLYPVISDASYSASTKLDKISFKSTDQTSAIAEFDGKILTLNISPALKVCNIELPSGALFSDVKVTSGSGFEKYSFTLKSGLSLDGYYVENTADGFMLYLKRRPKISASSSSPLAGITIMLDAGHGGSDNGSIGCLGLNMPEKVVNLRASLKTSQKLKALGANVILTRNSDSYISLQDRQLASFKAKPDLFLSLHANSMDDNVDISKISGLCVYYKNPSAYDFSKQIFSGTISDLNLSNKGLHSSNLYVARATWTPSAICEIGFMPNPHDMELMANDQFIDNLASSIANQITAYFS